MKQSVIFSVVLSSLLIPPLLMGAEKDSFESALWSREQLEEAFEAAGFDVRSLKLDLPVAQRSKFPFTSFEYEDPRLEELRRTYHLEQLRTEAPDEWTAQQRLKDWVYRRIPGGSPQSTPKTAHEILQRAAKGERFYCTYYAITYVECAHALGWQARKIGVDRKHEGGQVLGSTHHGVAEVWSNRFRKWVVMDAQSNLHFEKNGMPLSAWEIRSQWLLNQGADVDHVVGAPPHTVSRNPAMVWPVPDADEIATYYWVYVQDTAEVHSSSSKYILLEDEHNSSEIWYQNDASAGHSQFHNAYQQSRFEPTRRIEDAYWTVGFVEANLIGVAPQRLRLELDSYCPNFERYEVTRDGKTWQKVESAYDWLLQSGWNCIGFRTVNQAGVSGPEAAILALLKPR